METFVKEIIVPVKDTYYPVIKFGQGEKIIVMIAGVSLCGLEGQGDAIANAFIKEFSGYTFYLFDRIKKVPDNYSVQEMAQDLYTAMQYLNIQNAYVYGVSQGGMIAQSLACLYPNAVKKLALCSTVYKSNRKMKSSVKKWQAYCTAQDVVGLNRSFFDLVYSKNFLNSVKDLLPTLEKQGSIEDIKRFTVLLKACGEFMGVNLKAVKVPSIVIADKNDRVLGYKSSITLAKKLNAKLVLTDNYSHAVYDEWQGIKPLLKGFFDGE